MSREVLSVRQDDLDRMEHALGHEGPGVVCLRDAINSDFHKELLTEIHESGAVHWHNAEDTYPNDRGVMVEQKHDTFALRVVGDYEPVWAVSRMAELATATEVFVQSLSERYPTLGEWQADEMSYHRYYDERVGLTFHRDNMRFPGLIIAAAIEGEGDFQVIDRVPTKEVVDEETGKKMVTEWDWMSTYTIPTVPRDIVLTRAPGLLPEMKPSDRPEHAVMNLRALPRISFMLRANTRPNDRAYNFTYYNWPIDRSNAA